MRTCCCQLAGTVACRTCPSNVWMDSTENHLPFTPIPVAGQRIIEKYVDGKLVERVVENPPFTQTSSGRILG